MPSFQYVIRIYEYTVDNNNNIPMAGLRCFNAEIPSHIANEYRSMKMICTIPCLHMSIDQRPSQNKDKNRQKKDIIESTGPAWWTVDAYVGVYVFVCGWLRNKIENRLSISLAVVISVQSSLRGLTSNENGWRAKIIDKRQQTRMLYTRMNNNKNREKIYINVPYVIIIIIISYVRS